MDQMRAENRPSMVHLSKLVYSIAQVVLNLEINFGFDKEEFKCFNVLI
jgi:hypothetical protein